MAWLRIFAAVAGISLVAGSPAAAQLTSDDGACTAGMVWVYAGHEIGHDMAAIAVGESPWEPGLWGDKWHDSQRHHKRIALGGFVGQIWTATLESGSPDTFSRCTTHGNTLMSAFYALNAKRFAGNGEDYAGHAGDYSAFSLKERRMITGTSLGAAAFLEMTGESAANDEIWRREHSSLFTFESLFKGP